MKRLLTIYRQPGLDLRGSTLVRNAYRGIIEKDGKFLFIKSRKYGECKFPGGGQEDHEKAFDVLKREVAEETGYRIYAKIVPFGSTMEYAKDFEGKYDIFQQLSFYYFCRVHAETSPLDLEGYEIEYGYAPCWATLETAVANNLGVPANDRIPWKERDTEIMKMLQNGR
jgi:8-oxo-dGTP diphosphatase